MDATRYPWRQSVPLVPLGAGTGNGPRQEGCIFVRFDLGLVALRLPEGDEP